MIRRGFLSVLIAICLAFPAQPLFVQTPMPANVRAFGARGDAKTKDTVAFQTALDQCAKSGGGEVIVPAGDYLIGSIELKSNTTLRLEKVPISSAVPTWPTIQSSKPAGRVNGWTPTAD